MQKLEGKTLGAYRVISQIGAGGMATIFKAYQPSMDRTVALKVLPEYYAQDPQFVDRFNREARTIARLEHPNILPVYDFGEQDGITYLVMRFLEGGTLQEKMGQGGFSLHQTADLLVPICAALDYAHRQGIIHRDVKPSNVLIDREGAVYLSDFGIAKVLESSSRLTQTGTSLGTPAYMAPEQCLGKEVDRRSDIYSLGVILYEMAVGRVPFQADTPMAVLFAHVHEPLPIPRSINPTISEALQNVILKAMAKNPEDRFQTAAEMGTALRHATPPEEPNPSQPQPAVQSPPIEPVSAQAPQKVFTPVPQARAGTPPPGKAPLYRKTIAVNDEERENGFRQAQGGSKPSSGIQVKRLSTWALAVIIILAGVAGLTWLLAKQGTPRATPEISPVPATFVAQAPANTPPANTPPVTQPATETISPTRAPTMTLTLSGSSQGQVKKIGLVTDTGGISDKSFTQSAWAGVQKAAADFGFDAKFIESKQASDIEKNIDAFASQNVDIIVTVGFAMGDATAIKAKQYPKIKFATIDNAFFPTKGVATCDDTVKDCYQDGGLTNVTSLMFAEDQAGFLAGVLAAGMSKTGTVCSVAGLQIPAVERFVTGYQSGARWNKPNTQTFNDYLPSFTDPAMGKQTGVSMISKGCDVIFGVGGTTGNGALLAAKEANLMAIGVDFDQYYTYADVQSVLLSSAMKNVDAVVYEYLKSVDHKTDSAGIITATIANGGVGLAPFHDWDSKIPADVKARIQEAADGLKNGTLLPTGDSRGQIKIAILAPLSGPVPSFGVSTRDGALLAIDEWNAKGGVLGMKIVPVVEDSQCTAGPAVNAANKVIDQDKVHYIVGEVCSGASIPVSLIANARHVVQVSGTSTNPNVVRDANGHVKPYTFVACYNDETQGKVMARLAIENLKARTAFIMSDPANDYVKGLATYFEQYFAAHGGTIVGKGTYTSKDTDFSTILAKVAAAKPDLVVLPDYYNVVNLVTAQARQQNITSTFIGGDGWDSPDLDARAADGGYFTNHYSSTDNRPIVQAFVTNYGSKYKDDKGNPRLPDAMAALAYDATNMLLQSIQKAGVDDPTKVKDILAAGTFDAVSGRITFDPFHTPIKPVTIIHVAGGRIQYFTQIQP